MKKIIISILLITSLPLIGSTDNPKKQLPWQEKGKILRKHFYKYTVPTLIITEGLQKAIEQPNGKYIQTAASKAIPCAIGTVLTYPIIPYIAPIFLKLPKFATVYIPTFWIGTCVLLATKSLYMGDKANAAILALNAAYNSSCLYAAHKSCKEIQEKTDALHTRNQHVG